MDGSADDGLIEDLIRDCSREIDIYCNRRFYGEAETRYYDALRDTDVRRLFLDEDLVSVTTIKVNEENTTLTSSEYVTEPINRTPWSTILLKASSNNNWQDFTNDQEKSISVEGTWGYTIGSTPPRPIKRGCIELTVWRYLTRYGASPSIGMDSSTFEVSTEIPTHVQKLISPYRKSAIAGVGWT